MRRCVSVPQTKIEGWWLVLGNVATNELVSIKRVSMKKATFSVHVSFCVVCCLC